MRIARVAWVWHGLFVIRCGMSSVGQWRRHELVESWAHSTLQVGSIDMAFAPPVIVAQVHNLANSHWVLRLFLIAPNM